MKTIYCPNCDEPLPGSANFCATCGESLSSPGHKTAQLSPDSGQDSTVTVTVEPSPQERDSDADHPVINVPAVLPIIDKHTPPLASGLIRPATVNVPRRTRTGGLTTTPPPSGPLEDWDGDSTLALDEPNRQLTWHKEVESPAPFMSVAYSPRPAQPVAIILAPSPSRRVPPSLFFWVSVVVFCVLTLGGLFGVSGTLGYGSLSAAQGNVSLQITPGDVAIGATMALRGTNFTPHGRVGLTRDSSVPVANTSGQVVIEADGSGNFSDTVVVGQDWGVGAHTVSAEDATTHKIASFPIRVGGQSVALRPAHLALSATTLDLGSGDQATNNIKPITLINLGSGQISWQGSSTQSWLQLSPTSGTFSSSAGVRVMVAVDRANLKPGSYSAQINFSSNVGESSLDVTMQVTQLQVDHQAVLQLSPAVLAFTASDGSTSLTPQVITLGNPGVLPLNWSASSNVPWLTVASQSSGVDAGKNGQVKIQVDTSTLLPGTYEGMVTFSGQGATVATQNMGMLSFSGLSSNPVMHSPQSVYVSVTVTPHCGLQVAPGTLDFASAYLQPAPPVKIISLGNTESCATPLQWQAISNASWLSVSSPSGTTPGHPTIGINVAGLGPGVYHGSVSFNSSAGTQVLPVTFTMGEPTTPIMATAPASMAFSGLIGQGTSGGQTLTVSNTGGGVLHWRATSTTAMGGDWLSITPSSGSLGSHSSASLNILPTIPGSLVPGTYTGTVTITGGDDAGNAAAGNPQRIPISFVVNAPCTISASTQGLTFNGVAGAGNPGVQTISFKAHGGCANALTWTASVSGGSWLSATPNSGTVSFANAGTSNISVSLAGLGADTYHGTVTIKAIDSVTHAAIGQSIQVPVTLNVEQPCTLQGLSTNSEGFAAEIGGNPDDQTFTVSVGGGCSGNVVIAPTVDKGSGWLSVSPNPATILTGGTAVFTVHVNSASLSAGHYTGTVSLVATDGGNTIAGSSAAVGVTLDVQATPVLTAGPSGVTFNVTTGPFAQPITIKNAGGAPLNWTASLQNSPSFVSLSATSGTNLVAGDSASVNVTVDATGVQGGKAYTANVVVQGTDPVTGKPISGSPITIPITINVTAPKISVSTTDVYFKATQGNAAQPQSQSVVITNAGGGTLTWSAKQISSSWVVVDSAMQGSDAAGESSSLTLSVKTDGLVAKSTPYTATLQITSSVGQPITVTIWLTVTANTPSSTATPTTTSSTATPTTTSSTATSEVDRQQRLAAAS